MIRISNSCLLKLMEGFVKIVNEYYIFFMFYKILMIIMVRRLKKLNKWYVIVKI